MKQISSNELDIRQTELLNALKGIKIDCLDSYDLSHLLFNISREAVLFSSAKVLKRMLRIFLFDCVTVNYKNVDPGLPLMISYNYHRDDHTNYWNRFKEIIRDYNEISIDTVVPDKNVKRSLKNARQAYKSYKSIRKQLKAVTDGKARKLFAAYLAEMNCLREKIDSYEIKNKAAAIFFDGNHIENLVVQNLRNRGVKVATMQHGQPVFHGKDVDRVNQTMILNFSSDYVMVTGEFSKKQFIMGGVPEDKIFIGGSLRNIKPIQDSGNNDFALFLDCPTNPNAQRDNRELIDTAVKISSMLGSAFVIKCHPQDDPANYDGLDLEHGTFAPKGIRISDVLKDKAFGILHASGVYLDILSEGIKAFCYVNETDFALVEDGLDSFKNADELETKLNEWKGYELSCKNQYMQRVREYYLSPDNVEDRYLSFIRQLNEG